MGLKILHSADWHMDTPFTGVSPEQRRLLRQKLLDVPEQVMALARQEQCDLVLLSGDLFDGPCSRESVDAVRSALLGCGVPVFISPGNHDYCGPDSVWQAESWPGNVHIFSGGLSYVDLPDLHCRVYGAGYSSMDCPALLDGFQAEQTMEYSVAVLHGDPTTANSPCCPVTAAQVRGSGLDYLALGHIHKAGSFRAGGTLCGWPGSPMGRGWDETGERTVYLVTLEDTARIRPVGLNTLRFYELETAVGEDPALALEAILPPVPTDDFYRVTLRGRGEPDLAALCRRFSHIPNLELRDRCEQSFDMWADAGDDTLRGVFFRMLREELEEADPQRIEAVKLAAEISHALLDGREVTLP